MSNQDIFHASITFDSMGLRDSVLEGVRDAGFDKPTDIQAELIPLILSGKDVMGQAKTGTGKTAAFGLPLLHLCEKDIPSQALILVPTRELAAQVAGEIDMLAKHTPIRCVCIIGGESMRHQSKQVKGGAHIIVGTPGRVMDMQGRGEIDFRNIRFAILDEVDRMLDIGFREDIRKILSMIKRDHQTIFVSATIGDDIDKLARRFMRDDAEKIVTVSGSLTVAQVEQMYLSVQPWDKRSLLLHLLRNKEPDTTVVFCRTKATVHRVTQYLREKGINCREIHGDLPQAKRTRVMDAMRKGQLSVLVASDLAARGLDVDHISHVINYDLPEDSEIYIHRIGRTARAGRKGCAWSFVAPDEGNLLTNIEKLAGAHIELMDYPDFQPGPVPEGARTGQKSRRREVRDIREVVAERAAPAAAVDGLTQEQIKQMFPNGVVPKSAPKRTLGSRFNRRR